jgi:ketosteroid isomerase-like protein
VPEGNGETIERFYAAFGRRDGDAMAALYSPGAHFSDPVFPDLRGDEPGDMWRMLTGRSEDLTVELAEHDERSARWIAHYTFGATGRKVRNDVRATFEFAEDGRIARHRDEFDFYAWARQALGPPGLLLGWTPLIRSSVRKRAAAQLAEFRGERA